MAAPGRGRRAPNRRSGLPDSGSPERWNGPHSEAECFECHSQDIEPGYTEANVDCLDCHTQNEADNDHQDEPDYQWTPSDPDFCRDCHPDGRD